MAASDISDASAAFQLRHHPVECRQPIADQIVLIAGAEKPSSRAEQTGALVAPRDATAVLERGLDFFQVGLDRRHSAERANHGDRAVINRKDHRLFWRQCELLGGRIIRKVVGGGMVRCPFPQISLIHPRFSGKLVSGHWSFLMQSLIETERITDLDKRYTYCTTKIIQHLADKLMQLSFVHFCSLQV